MQMQSITKIDQINDELVMGRRKDVYNRNLLIEHQELLKKCWITGKSNGKGWNVSRTKRCLSIFFALMGLLALAPLLISIAILIKLESKGPILFTQYRTGFMGRRFKIYKFRTMVVDAEQIKEQVAHLNRHRQNSPDFKITDDPRVTRLGKFLRRYSLDEFPQLINVLKGDMRLIGPRPTSFSIEKYQPHHLVRLASPPGLTGIWQISGRSGIDFEGRVKLDYAYIVNQSPIQDLKILLKTPMAILKADGAC